MRTAEIGFIAGANVFGVIYLVDHVPFGKASFNNCTLAIEAIETWLTEGKVV